MKPKFEVRLTVCDGVLAIRLHTTIQHGHRDPIPIMEAGRVIGRFAGRAGRKQTDAAKQVVLMHQSGHHLFVDTTGDAPQVVCAHDGIVKSVVELGGTITAATAISRLSAKGLLNGVKREEIMTVLDTTIFTAPLVPGLLGAQRERTFCFG